MRERAAELAEREAQTGGVELSPADLHAEECDGCGAALPLSDERYCLTCRVQGLDR